MNDKSQSENRFDELILFIRGWLRGIQKNITGQTLIEDDLGVTGEEAEELLEAFGKKFKVNIDNLNSENIFFRTFHFCNK